ncbi:MAG TPA: ABC transporter permease [Longimicrobiaceae bacterium]|nr:ABC transporter permease [Longimicrobiaceae bacterium]
MSALLQDIRHAARSLARSPAFTLTAILCLSLGIGINTGVFSIINTFLIRPLPFPEPERVLMLFTTQARQEVSDAPFSPADLGDLRAQSRTLEDAAGMATAGFNLALGDEPERVRGAYVTHNLFGMLGVAPMLGRGILPEEDRPGAGRVVVLSERLWRRRFGARPDVAGSRVLISGHPYTVVGVMPTGFRFPEAEDLWIPLRAEPAESRADRYLWTVARLREGATLQQANAELPGIAARLAAAHPGTNAGWSFGAKPWREEYVENGLRLMLYLMMGAVGFVLLIACANVANLLLARSAARRREIAIRLALGAGRGRIVRQLLTESALVALPAGALGAVTASWWLDWVASRVPEEITYWMRFDVDGTVLLFTLLLSLATAVLFGLLPALRAARADVQGAIKEGGRGATGGVERSRLRSALVTGEIALSVVLLVGAVLLVRSFVAALNADLGFDTRRLLAMRTSITGERYDATAARAGFFLRTAERMRALPGVRDAALTTALPGDDGGVGVTIVAEGQQVAPGEETSARWIGITPSYFGVVGRPLLAGRTFTDAETADSLSTSIILNDVLARAFWPGQDPLGKRVRLNSPDEPWLTVVGVAPTLHYEEVGEASAASRRQVHVPYARGGWRLMTLMVRTSVDPAGAAGPVRQALREMDPTVPVFDVRTMDEYRAYTTWDKRIMGEVFGMFGMLALVLAAVGVYGVMAYAVSQRYHEIGIRVALGAQRRHVMRLVVGEGAVLAAIGVALGLVGAFGVSRVMASVLYGVSPSDPVAFLLVPVLLAGVALLASWLPARRATRIDPMVALRAE